MADCVGNIVQRHLPVIIGLHCEGGIDAAQLLDGENPGDGQRLWIGIPSRKLGIDLAQILHGFPAQLPHLPQIGPRGGRRVLGLAGIGA